MHIELREVVKEYVLFVDGLNFTVKGRVSKLVDGEGNQQFHWDISHHCRPSEKAGGVYYPSVTVVPEFETARDHLLGYMRSFTKLDVTKNDSF